MNVFFHIQNVAKVAPVREFQLGVPLFLLDTQNNDNMLTADAAVA